MVWCGVVWCGVVRWSVMRCGVTWRGVVWCVMAHRGVLSWRGAPGHTALKDKTSCLKGQHSSTGIPRSRNWRACGWRPILTRVGILGSMCWSERASRMARSSSYSQQPPMGRRADRVVWWRVVWRDARMGLWNQSRCNQCNQGAINLQYRAINAINVQSMCNQCAIMCGTERGHSS